MPLAIDLFCGLGGWTEGLLAEGYDVIGFDIEQHVYGEHRYPAQLVVQDVLTLHGSQFKNADLIVASPPCQFFSYCAMPWTRAKELAAAVRADPARLEKELALFDACFRIQREACAAAGRHIPLVVENVRGAQEWVGRSRWAFGSFHLWGDVPALMPLTARAVKVPGMGAGWRPPGHPDHKPGLAFNPAAQGQTVREGRKNTGGSWFNIAHNTTSGKSQNPVTALEAAGRKQPGLSGMRANGKGDRWFQDGAAKHGSKSSARKAASAMIAKIPTTLSRHIAATYLPTQARAA